MFGKSQERKKKPSQPAGNQLARMAADEQQQQRTGIRWKGRRKALVLVVEERRMDLGGISTYHLFNINIKDMFTRRQSQYDQEEDDDGDWAVLRPLPRPVAQLDTLRRLAIEYFDFAVIASNTIVGVSNRKRTVLCECDTTHTTGEVSPGLELPGEIHGGMVLIPLGTGVYAIGNRPCRTSPTFPLLLPPSRVSGGGRRRRASCGAARCEDGWAPARTSGCRSGTPAPTPSTPPMGPMGWRGARRASASASAHACAASAPSTCPPRPRRRRRWSATCGRTRFLRS